VLIIVLDQFLAILIISLLLIHDWGTYYLCNFRWISSYCTKLKCVVAALLFVYAPSLHRYLTSEADVWIWRGSGWINLQRFFTVYGVIGTTCRRRNTYANYTGKRENLPYVNLRLMAVFHPSARFLPPLIVIVHHFPRSILQRIAQRVYLISTW